jgi:hypothetical protein
MRKPRRRPASPLLFGLLCFAITGMAHAENTECGNDSQPSHYIPQAGDRADSTHFTADRLFNGVTHLEVDVCAGELRIVGSAQPGHATLSITSPGADRSLGKYMQGLSVQDGAATISVRVPKRFHAVITLALPRGEGDQSEINLGAGTLILNADVLSGSRELNVGAGEAEIALDDRNFATLQANIGMGMLEDDRPHGKNAYFVVSRSSNGQGTGNIEVNVGAGEIVLKAAEE